MDQATVAEPVDLTPGLSNTVAVLKSKARAKSVAVVVDVEPDLPRVRGFAGELNQIWANLIDNALDAVARIRPRRGAGEPRASARRRARHRQRDRHPGEDPRAHLRPVLHHQAGRAGHRPRPRHRPAPGPPQRRRNRGRVAARAERSFASRCRSPRSTAPEERREQAGPPRRGRRSAGARRRAPRSPLPVPGALHRHQRGIGRGGAGDRPRTEEPRRFAGHGHQRSADAGHAGSRSARADRARCTRWRGASCSRPTRTSKRPSRPSTRRISITTCRSRGIRPRNASSR